MLHFGHTSTDLFTQRTPWQTNRKIRGNDEENVQETPEPAGGARDEMINAALMQATVQQQAEWELSEWALRIKNRWT